MREAGKARVLVTGATGFIGSDVVAHLAGASAWQPVLGLRRKPEAPTPHPWAVTGELSPDTDWREALRGCAAVVHCAARAHILKDSSDDPWEGFYQANVQGTLNLAHQTAEAGVMRFIFISSIGVNGNINSSPFTENDPPQPAEFYAQSKWEAEQGLWDIQRDTGMEIVIIRPPLVYGPDAPGNFGALVRWVNKGVPLPLGAVHNKRSLVALDNLVNLIITCIDHPAAANQVFLAGDGQDLSTTELLRGVARAMGRPSRLVSVPAGMLTLGATLLGKKAVAQRLLGSLQVDISKARNLLGWKPPLSLDEGLECCFSKPNKGRNS